MPQVDIETLVCGGGGDRKVVCETLIEGDEKPNPPAPADPDLPAESFLVRVEDEIDWVDLNAVYDRDDSTKGNTNPKSNHSNSSTPKPRSNSQRYTNLKAKASIIGLPNKLQHSGYLGNSARRPPNTRIFPKKAGRGGGGGKSAVPEFEPTSPKVSCFGKVLSERERDRCRIAHRRLTEKDGGTGCWKSLLAVFRCRGGEHTAAVESVEDTRSTPSGNIPAGKKRSAAREPEPGMAGPGLGGMKRFASGRRTESWSGEMELEMDGHVEGSGPLRPEVWGRRSVGSLEDAERYRDWEENDGSASV